MAGPSQPETESILSPKAENKTQLNVRKWKKQNANKDRESDRKGANSTVAVRPREEIQPLPIQQAVGKQ